MASLLKTAKHLLDNKAQRSSFVLQKEAQIRASANHVLIQCAPCSVNIKFKLRS